MRGALRCRIHGDVITSFVGAIQKLVKAQREHDEALVEAERLFRVAADALDREVAAKAAIERVKALHVIAGIGPDVVKFCCHDNRRWPCPTIRAIEEPTS
jgi:hypothetical protein